ncbi:MAG: riboflavin synthase [Rhodothermales bacterium]|nr:riboflavin synthase [Rhodothermales bacterium]
MFTGIIEEVGRIAGVEDLGGGRRLHVEASFAPQLRPDESVAINGACMTVVQVDGLSFDVVVVEESLRKTTLGDFTAGLRVNLERAMRMDGRMDGHFVQGHVDATGVVEEVVEEVTNRLYRIRFAPEYAGYLVPQGSVAIDGISLTIARLERDTLTVAIIPHTLAHANVPAWTPGARVNLEFDMIGKYIVRFLEHRGRDPETMS